MFFTLLFYSVGTVVIPNLVDVVDVFSAQRVRSSGATEQLDNCHVERWGLSLESPTPDDPLHEAEIMWLLPALGVRLRRMRTRQRHARRGPSTLTAVIITQDARTWSIHDLLLGLEVPDHGSARIAHAEEFAAAVAHGQIRPSEADYALHTVHRTLEELSLHRDLNQWLAHQGIFDLW